MFCPRQFIEIVLALYIATLAPPGDQKPLVAISLERFNVEKFSDQRSCAPFPRLYIHCTVCTSS
jgi:hypothetical protein